MTPEHLDYRSQSPAARARDAALARVGRARRWVIVGAAALTAGFAALVSAVAPGRSLAHRSNVSSRTARSSSSSRSGSAIPPLPALASAGQLGLQGPGQAPSTPDQSQPQSIPSQPPPAAAPPSSGGGGGVVSGGS